EACGYLVRQSLAVDNFDEAQQYLARFEQAAPNAVALTWFRAAILSRQGRVDEALATFGEALATNASNVELRLRLADLLNDLGRADEAAAELEVALRLEPSSGRVFSRILSLAQARNRPPEEIVERCEQFLTIAPNNETALLQRANG